MKIFQEHQICTSHFCWHQPDLPLPPKPQNIYNYNFDSLELMMSSWADMVQLKYLCQKGNVLHSLFRCCCNINIWLSAGFLGVCWGLERKHKHIICRIKECPPPMGCVLIVKHKGNVIMNLNIHKEFWKKTLLHSEWAESHKSASAWFIQCNPLFKSGEVQWYHLFSKCFMQCKGPPLMLQISHPFHSGSALLHMGSKLWSPLGRCLKSCDD